MKQRKKKKGKKKRTSQVKKESLVWHDSHWNVFSGTLVPTPGRPGKIENLFSVFAEKLPYDSIDIVKKYYKGQYDEGNYRQKSNGVYIAHDSMGFPRYIGRGNVFARLKACRKVHADELEYFSFFIVRDKKHEREIETLLIRAAGPLLEFNERKKRVSIKPGNVRDFEAGSKFLRRNKRPGAKKRS